MRSASRWMFATLALVALALIVPWAIAQANQGMGQGQGMHYDPSTVVTLKGTVQEVQQGTAPAGRQQMGGMGVHLILKTEKETETILVGPQGFLTQNNFSFSNGDEIEVTGSRVKYGTSEAIIAREIKKGDKTLTLRNEQGVPAWSGRGPR